MAKRTGVDCDFLAVGQAHLRFFNGLKRRIAVRAISHEVPPGDIGGAGRFGRRGRSSCQHEEGDRSLMANRGVTQRVRRSAWLMIGRLRDEAMLLFASYAALLNHDENIQAEIAWMKKFRPENDKPYAGAYDYALWRYELVKGYWDKLDGTADSIARYAGSVATLAGSVGLGFATVAKIFGSQAGAG